MVKAEKKSPKETTKATVATTKAIYDSKSLRDKDLNALVSDLQAVNADLADARRSLAAGELVNPNVINQHRKSIARIKTIIVEKARAVQGKEDA